MKGHQRAWRTCFRTPQHGAFNRYSIPILPIAALLILLTSAVAARAEELLLPLLRSQMGEEASAQKQVVEELRRLPTTQSLELVRINTNALRAASTQLSIPNLSTITLSKSYDNVTDPTNFTWYGTLTGIPGQATLVVHNNNVTGSIQDGATFYRIEPVGNGVHALIKVDRERFPPEAPPILEHREQRGDVPAAVITPHASKSDAPPSACAWSSHPNGPCPVGVLVAYTAAARKGVADIAGLIQLAVAQTNQSFKNSNINIKLYLSDSRDLEYSESGEHKSPEESLSWMTKIVTDFAKNSEVQNWRDTSGADVSGTDHRQGPQLLWSGLSRAQRVDGLRGGVL